MNDSEWFLNLLKILINNLESGQWKLKEGTINAENNWYEHCGIPIELRSKSYDIKCEIEPVGD